MLLFIISVFYIPGALDPKGSRMSAWMHVFPSRACGATFFTIAVVFFGQPIGFLSIALVDGAFGLATLYCLLQITREEQSSEVHPSSFKEWLAILPKWVIWLAHATIAMQIIQVIGLLSWT